MSTEQDKRFEKASLWSHEEIRISLEEGDRDELAKLVVQLCTAIREGERLHSIMFHKVNNERDELITVLKRIAELREINPFIASIAQSALDTMQFTSTVKMMPPAQAQRQISEAFGGPFPEEEP